MVERCYVPKSLEEALSIRKETGAHPLAGGSDLMVQYKQGLGITPVFPFPVMIISSLDDLKGIETLEDGSILIRALSTPAEIASFEGMPYPVRCAASRMGAVALRNTATIGGNLGNASPKGDLPQPLILLDATVVLKSQDGEREMKVDDFILGSKKTALAETEDILKGHGVDEMDSLMPAILEGWNNAISPHAMPEYRRATTRRMLEHFLSGIAAHQEGGIIE